MPSGKEMAPASTGASTGAANSPRNSAARNFALRGGGPTAEPGGLIDAKSGRQRWRSLGVLDAQRRGECACVCAPRGPSTLGGEGERTAEIREVQGMDQLAVGGETSTRRTSMRGRGLHSLFGGWSNW